MNNDILFSNLKKLRKSHKLTQIDVAELIGKDRSLIAKYESGKAVPPLNILKSFAKIYNVSVDSLCNDTFDDNPTIVFASPKKKKKGQLSFSELSDVEREIILKLRLLDDSKLDEIYEKINETEE